MNHLVFFFCLYIFSFICIFFFPFAYPCTLFATNWELLMYNSHSFFFFLILDMSHDCFLLLAILIPLSFPFFSLSRFPPFPLSLFLSFPLSLSFFFSFFLFCFSSFFPYLSFLFMHANSFLFPSLPFYLKQPFSVFLHQRNPQHKFQDSGRPCWNQLVGSILLHWWLRGRMTLTPHFTVVVRMPPLKLYISLVTCYWLCKLALTPELCQHHKIGDQLATAQANH